MRLSQVLATSLLLGLLLLGTGPVNASPETDFVEEWTAKGLSSAYLKDALSQATRQDEILEAIQRPWEAKPWYQYYPLFLTQERLDRGLAFWAQHQAELERAEQELGVEAEVIVAIIGVETFYGRHLGKHKVLDALYTLGFHYPPRQRFFRSELGHFLALAQEQQWPLGEILGSYAGAMGYGQFIPSSYRAYAVDFDGDGKRDLLQNPKDAIGSVANYLAKHKWQFGQPVAEEASLTGTAKLKPVLWNGKPVKHTADKLQQHGVKLPKPFSSKAAVLKLKKSEDAWQYFVVHPNFYSITRYNHSPLYAMAVWHFAQQLKQHKTP